MWIIFINQTTTVGTFPSKDEALAWARFNMEHEDWMPVKVTRPEDFPTR